VYGDLDQIGDQLLLTVAWDAGDRPHMRVRQPTRGHRLDQRRERGQGPDDADVLDRGPPRQPAEVAQPPGGGAQPEPGATVARIELGHQ